MIENFCFSRTTIILGVDIFWFVPGLPFSTAALLLDPKVKLGEVYLGDLAFLELGRIEEDGRRSGNRRIFWFILGCNGYVGCYSLEGRGRLGGGSVVRGWRDGFIGACFFEYDREFCSPFFAKSSGFVLTTGSPEEQSSVDSKMRSSSMASWMVTG